MYNRTSLIVSADKRNIQEKIDEGDERMNPEIRKDSEEYARQEAEREDVWQEKYGRKLPELCGRFDEILRGEDEGKTERLEVLLQSDEVKVTLPDDRGDWASHARCDDCEA